MIEFRDAKHLPDGGISVIVTHPVGGEIAFTATADDVDPFGRALWDALQEEGVDIAPADPVAPDVPVSVTRLQLARGLDDLGLWDLFEAALEAPETPSEIKRDWSLANEIKRSDPLVTAFAGGLNLTEAEVDAAFIQAATHV